MSSFHYPQAATGCTGAYEPGTKCMEVALLAAFGHQGVGSLGIYNCRAPRGGVGWSIHAEGRALDLAPGVQGKWLGDELLAGLLGTAWELGLQRVIWWDRQYDVNSPNGKPYSGVDPHHSHLHIEQTREAASTLDLAAAVRIIDGWTTGMALSEDQVAAIVRRVLAEGKGYGQRSWPTTVQATLALTQNLTNAVAALDALVRELLDVAGATDTTPVQGAEALPADTVDDRSGQADDVAGDVQARTQGPADPSGYPQPGAQM